MTKLTENQGYYVS